MKIILLIIFLIILMAGSMYVAYEIWISISDVEISLHGKIAMAFGITFTFLLGTGLMFLVFYSSRKGYDRENNLTETSTYQRK